MNLLNDYFFLKSFYCMGKEHKTCYDCMHINGGMLATDRKLTTSDVRVIKWLTGCTVDAEFVESPYISEDWLKTQSQ